MQSAAAPARSLWHAGALALLFLIGSVKNDLEVFARSEFWSKMTVGPVTQLLKQNVPVLYGLLAVCFAIAMLQNRKIAFVASVWPSLFVLLYFYAAVATSFEDPDLAYAFAIAGVALALVQMLLASAAAGGRDVIAIVRHALLIFSIGLIALNLGEYVSGNGVVPGIPRFFGTAAHPNFIGVQMAVCSLAVLFELRARSGWTLALRYALFAAGVWLMFLSGSRTALAVLVCGFLIGFGLANRASKTVWFGLGLLCLGAVLVVSGLFGELLSADVYNRDVVSSRSGAWAGLWRSVTEAPILGHGHLPRYSENSMLRGWATIGVAYPLVMIAITVGFGGAVLRSLGTPQLRRAAGLCGLFAGLIVGSVFEGYLFDANSLPWSSWFVSLCAVTLYLRETQAAARHGTLRTGAPALRAAPHPARR